MRNLDPLSRLVFRALGSLLSPGGRRGSLLVLIFHRVLPEPDPLLPDEPDADAFAAQMDLLCGSFNLLSLGEAASRLGQGTLPPRAACVTFDDGYANNVDIAAPILAARSIPATFFIATGFIGGGRMWNDTVIETIRAAPPVLDLEDLGLGAYRCSSDAERCGAVTQVLNRLKYVAAPERARLAERIAARATRPLPAGTMMTESQLRRLLDMGMELGAHTVTHPILTALQPAEAGLEIAASRARLEEIAGAPIKLFAYPNGRPGRDYSAEHVAMVRDAGFETAVSTGWGCVRPGTDRLQMPRIAPWDRDARRYVARLLKGYTEQPVAI
jgi:peptidoglycan/xylan/chitin deacetylase (PgdA/CDA1 family)